MIGFATYVSADGQIEYVPVAPVNAGDVVVLGNSVGVANRPIAAGALGALHVEGVFDVAKHAGETFAFGDKVFWDPVNHWATATGGAGLADLGTCTRAAAGGDAAVRVLLVRRA